MKTQIAAASPWILRFTQALLLAAGLSLSAGLLIAWQQPNQFPPALVLILGILLCVALPLWLGLGFINLLRKSRALQPDKTLGRASYFAFATALFIVVLVPVSGVVLLFSAGPHPPNYFCSTDHPIYQYLAVHGPALYEEIENQPAQHSPLRVNVGEHLTSVHAGTAAGHTPFIFIQARELFARSPYEGGGFAYAPDRITNLRSTFSDTTFTYLDETVLCYYPDFDSGTD